MNPWRFAPHMRELSDLLTAWGPDGRAPVRLDDVRAALAADGNPYGAGLIADLPAVDGVLVPEAVDALLLRAHREIQRLALELQQGPRTRDRLAPLLAGLPRPARVVDVGCGLGYVLRWLAARSGLAGVEWVGADHDGALIAEATFLAGLEALPVTFHRRDAFTLDLPADVYLSSGVLHHVPAAALPGFFAAQSGARAFLHTDFQASVLAAPGSWLFHTARMSVPLAVHDGILSAVRAHPAETLLAAARSALPRWTIDLVGTAAGPLPRALHTLRGRAP